MSVSLRSSPFGNFSPGSKSPKKLRRFDIDHHASLPCRANVAATARTLSGVSSGSPSLL